MAHTFGKTSSRFTCEPYHLAGTDITNGFHLELKQNESDKGL